METEPGSPQLTFPQTTLVPAQALLAWQVFDVLPDFTSYPVTQEYVTLAPYVYVVPDLDVYAMVGGVPQLTLPQTGCEPLQALLD